MKLTMILLLLPLATKALEIPDIRQLLSGRGRRLGTCDDIHDNEGGDVTGYHCDGAGKSSRSIYCSCYSKRKTKYKKGKSKTKYEYECEKMEEEFCTVGSPPCQFGRCKDLSEACGIDWSLDPTKQTCVNTFDASTQGKELGSCTAIFGSDTICPASALPAGYLGWANAMGSGDKIKDAVAAAAMDTVWWWGKFNTMVRE